MSPPPTGVPTPDRVPGPKKHSRETLLDLFDWSGLPSPITRFGACTHNWRGDLVVEPTCLLATQSASYLSALGMRSRAPYRGHSSGSWPGQPRSNRNDWINPWSDPNGAILVALLHRRRRGELHRAPPWPGHCPGRPMRRSAASQGSLPPHLPAVDIALA